MPWMEFVRELPEDSSVKKRADLKETHTGYRGKTEGYLKVQMLGVMYYVPLTSKIKKQLGITRRGSAWGARECFMSEIPDNLAVTLDREALWDHICSGS